MPADSANSSTASRHPRVGLVCLLSVLVLLPILSSAHRHTDVWAPRYSRATDVQFLPTGDFLKGASLGYAGLLSDFFWVRATMLFGDQHGAGEDKGWYAWLYHMIDLTTDLDPEFRAAYKYGGTMLRVDGVFVDQSSLIFQKGMKHRPDEWYFPFGIAMNYFLHRDDPQIAARYMEAAATIEGAPFYLRNLAASLLEDSNQLDAALAFTEAELANLPTGQDAVRIALELKIFELRYAISVRDVEQAVETYRRENGGLPESVAALPGLPSDPLGGVWTWDRRPDSEEGAVFSSKYCEVFTKLSREASLGELSLRDCETLD